MTQQQATPINKKRNACITLTPEQMRLYRNADKGLILYSPEGEAVHVVHDLKYDHNAHHCLRQRILDVRDRLALFEVLFRGQGHDMEFSHDALQGMGSMMFDLVGQIDQMLAEGESGA